MVIKPPVMPRMGVGSAQGQGDPYARARLALAQRAGLVAPKFPTAAPGAASAAWRSAAKNLARFARSQGFVGSAQGLFQGAAQRGGSSKAQAIAAAFRQAQGSRMAAALRQAQGSHIAGAYGQPPGAQIAGMMGPPQPFPVARPVPGASALPGLGPGGPALPEGDENPTGLPPGVMATDLGGGQWGGHRASLIRSLVNPMGVQPQYRRKGGMPNHQRWGY